MTGAFGRTLVAASLAAAFPSWALWDDKLEVFAQVNATHDSNVFRFSDNVATGPRSDTAVTTAVGAMLNVPWSLQRFQANVMWYDARYRRFEDLDHRGHRANAAWLWSVTTRLTGELGVTHNRGLASFANIQGTEPDLVTTRSAYGNAAWMVSPSWRLHALLVGAEVEHTGARSVNDLEVATAEMGVSFVTAQENRLGVAYRREEGKNPRSYLLFGQPFDNAYEQDSLGMQGRWVITGLSRLDGRVDYTRRRYEQLSQRDYSGPTFRLTHTYTPTGKFTVATSVQRDIAPLEDITSSFVLVTGITVRPDWAVTEKINVRGNLSYSRWEYFADQIFSQDFEHKVKNIGISVMYRPTRRIALSTGVAREVRTSTLSNADYKVDTAMVEARIGF